MIRSILAAAVCTAIPAAVLAAPAQAASAPATPGAVTSVTARPGPGAGQVTFSWSQDGSHTTAFQIETGLTPFRPNAAALPDHGRDATTFYVAPNRRSVTLSASATARAGASVASANHLYYRFRAVNRTASGYTAREYGYLQSVAVRPVTPASTGTPLRIASFNVLTATDRSYGRPWLQRVPLVAKTILSRNPGVVALQELGTGRADGQPIGGGVMQTDSLVTSLAQNGGQRYKLVRSTRYVKPGTPEAIQGARILYDTSRYSLVSHCPDTSLAGDYSSSCTISLPLLRGDSRSLHRHAAFAVFADRNTGKRFMFASVHLDARNSTNSTTERTYERLRATQIRWVINRLNLFNTSHLPIVVAGDLNTFQAHMAGYDAHDALISSGFYDTAAAENQTAARYTTMNHMDTTLTLPSSGWGSRLDVITVKGVRGATDFENVMRVTDSNRPSDHNMVMSDIRLG